MFSTSPSRHRFRVCNTTKLQVLRLEDGTAPAVAQPLAQAYGQIPLSFEVNQGQTDSQVQYLAHGQGYGLFLTANPAAQVFGLGHQPDLLR
jgi:hypothetical protein